MSWRTKQWRESGKSLTSEKRILKGWRRGFLFSLGGILFLFFSLSSEGWGQNSQNLSRSLEGLGFNQDIRVEGASEGFSAFFFLPRMQKLSGEMLWRISPSPLLREDSVFTFYVDDRLVLTRTAADLRENSEVSVPLSGDLSPSRFLHLRVESRMHITEDFCRDLFTGQLFFTVHRDSSLSFQDFRIPRRTVSDFFETLFDSLYIVLPQTPSLSESGAAIWLGAMLRKAVPGLSVSYVSEIPREGSIPFVFLAGSAEALPEGMPSRKGISLIGEEGLLLLQSEDSGTLKDMVRGLSCFAAFGAMPSSSIFLENLGTPQNSPSTNLLNMAEGRGKSSILLEVPVFPGFLTPLPETLSFELEGAFTAPHDVSHPARLDLYWNDVFLESEHLPPDGSFRKKILLPSGISVITENRLRLMISYYKDERACRYESPENRGTLFASSTFHGHGTYSLQGLSWNSFGLFALSVGLLLLDPRLSMEVIRSAGDMLFWLSNRYPQGIFLFPEIRTTRAEAADIGKASWLLVISSPGEIPESVQALLPLDMREGFLLRTHRWGTFRYSYEEEEDLALFLLGSSSKPVLLLSSSRPPMMAEGAAFFTSPKNAGSLSGNLLAFRSSKDIRVFDTRTPFVTVERGLIRPFFERLWFFHGKIIILSIWVLVTLFFGMLLLKKRRKT